MDEVGAEVDPETPAEASKDPATDGTFSAGEAGQAVGEADFRLDGGRIEVVVGEIPDPEDLAHMLWTARCDYPEHGLLGTFEERTEAEECRKQHLIEEHAGQGLN